MKLILKSKKCTIATLIILLPFLSFSQKIDSVDRFFTGQITATNNGISLIPSFSLGKPALLFDLSIGKGKLSFDPMLRWGMNGKPWAFVFWWHYKLIQTPKFKISVGAHPSVVFRNINAEINGSKKELLSAQRFFAWEATPNYFPHKKIGFAFSYLGSKGLSKEVVKNTTFLAFRTILTNIKLFNKYSLFIAPQFFYLKMDAIDGTYLSGVVALNKKKSPINISSIMSKKINSQIAGNDFTWNMQLTYNLNNHYKKIGGI